MILMNFNFNIVSMWSYLADIFFLSYTKYFGTKRYNAYALLKGMLLTFIDLFCASIMWK